MNTGMTGKCRRSPDRHASVHSSARAAKERAGARPLSLLVLFAAGGCRLGRVVLRIDKHPILTEKNQVGAAVAGDVGGLGFARLRTGALFADPRLGLAHPEVHGVTQSGGLRAV